MFALAKVRFTGDNAMCAVGTRPPIAHVARQKPHRDVVEETEIRRNALFVRCFGGRGENLWMASRSAEVLVMNEQLASQGCDAMVGWDKVDRTAGRFNNRLPRLGN